MMLKKVSPVIFLAFVFILAGCSIEPVKPWDRDLLAEDKMQLVPDAVEEAFDAHIYFSKESSFGGAGIGGGGCGCN